MSITKKCSLSKKDFEITDFELEFYKKISPKVGFNILEIPFPTLSPLERRRRRLSFRNLRYLYHRKCDLSGKNIISIYPPTSKHTVYHTDEWWSDQWNAATYARDYDFNRPFFEQFQELFIAVPVPYRFGVQNENCEYINGAANCKDCYLCFNLDYCEKCFYLTDTIKCLSCADCLITNNSELCYQCIECDNCYGLNYSQRCSSCSNSYFLNQCKQCVDCIGCCNITNKENYILNQKASKEEVKKLKEKLQTRTGLEEFQIEYQKFIKQFPRRYYHGHSNQNFSGDHLQHVSNVQNSFQCFELEYAANCYYVFNSNNCVDLDVFGDKSSWIYECTATGINCSNVLFCLGAWAGVKDTLYSIFVAGVANCFGCVGLRKSDYCILNKQYSKNDYEEMLPRIVNHMKSTGEWGEFFSPKISPFPYNETLAHEYFPLSAEVALKYGFSWREAEEKKSITQSYILSEHIKDTSDNVTQETLSCINCKVNYKITALELALYRNITVPVPNTCPNCRHQHRRSLLNPPIMSLQQCKRCNTQISSTYPTDTTLEILCEECFRKEVY